MAETWGDVFQAALAKGCDQASAATRADDWERRQRKSGVADLIGEVGRLRQEIEDMRAALADAIRRPMGVIPASAARFVTAEDLTEAEERRPRLEPKA